MGCVGRTNQRASARAHLWCRVNYARSVVFSPEGIRIVSGPYDRTVGILGYYVRCTKPLQGAHWPTFGRFQARPSVTLCKGTLATSSRLHFLPTALASSPAPLTRSYKSGILCHVHHPVHPLQGYSRRPVSCISPNGTPMSRTSTTTINYSGESD